MRTLISPQGSVATMPDALAETLLGLGWVVPGRRAADATEPVEAPDPEPEGTPEPKADGAPEGRKRRR